MSESATYHDKKDFQEAFGTFSAARNLFFWLILAGLLITSAGFWIVDAGLLDKILLNQADRNPVYLGYSQNKIIPTQNEPPIASGTSRNVNPAPQAGPKNPPEKSVNSENPVRNPYDRKLHAVKILDEMVRSALVTSRYGLMFSVVLYCLSLLTGMQLALVGGLGGLAHSSKAFFLSMVVVVFVVPWQSTLVPDAPGSLFLYAELTVAYQQKCQDFQELWHYIMYYSRFVGTWLLSIILLLAAQRQSCLAVRTMRSATMSKTEKPLPSAESSIALKEDDI